MFCVGNDESACCPARSSSPPRRLPAGCLSVGEVGVLVCLAMAHPCPLTSLPDQVAGLVFDPQPCCPVLEQKPVIHDSGVGNPQETRTQALSSECCPSLTASPPDSLSQQRGLHGSRIPV